MKAVLYTDDRSQYSEGNYYTDWINAFKDLVDLDIAENIAPQHARSPYELMIFGHGYIDYNGIRGGSSAEARLGCFKKFMRRFGLVYPYVYARHFRGKKIFMSKNDYKGIDSKRELSDYLRVDLFVTHTKQALTLFPESLRKVWIPFGVNLDRCKDYGMHRDLDVGFIGNAHLSHVGDIRLAMAEKLINIGGEVKCDVRVNRPNEHLLGMEYVKWLNRCKLVMCTSSAMGTVGPRFYEVMACGGVPLAPLDDYEGLLIPELHYVPVRRDLGDLEPQIKKFLTNVDYRNSLLTSCKKFVERHDVKLLARNLLKGL